MCSSDLTVSQALHTLQHKGLAIRVSGAGHRVEKFGHRLGEVLNMGRRELAILCVLMLRGAQTVGELRGRTERMHEFADMEEVEHVLHTLASRQDGPLVAAMPRGRWAQLLGGTPDSAPELDGAPTVRSELERRVELLEQEVAELRREIETFRRQFE